MIVIYIVLSTLVAQTWAQLTTPAIYQGFVDSGFCATPRGIIKDACGATFSAVEQTNRIVRPIISNLVKTDYFRYYKIDLWNENCPFVDDDSGMCGNHACSVDPVEDESEIPEFWRTQYLSRLAKDSYSTENSLDIDEEISNSCVTNDGPVSSVLGYMKNTTPKHEYELDNEDNQDYCYPDDESNDSPGVYVSLVDNPERFTGYSGSHASKIWRAIYQENCFGYAGDTKYSLNPATLYQFEETSVDHASQMPFGVSQLERVMMDTNKYEIQEVGGEIGREAMNTESQCVEQRFFYRLLSGLHASISTHLCYDHLNKTSGEWGPNENCFMNRVGNHPERISNLYFNYAMVARSISKLRNYIDDLYFCREDVTSDNSTRKQLLLLARASDGRHIFNETLAFATPEAKALKDEFRKRVKKVSALMNCVGCDRCRLWGKVQVAGYGTALKILFELPEKPEDDIELSNKVLSSFRRSELVALVNVFDRLSKSIEAVQYFRRQVKIREEEVKRLKHSAALEAESAKQTTETSQQWEWDPEFEHAWRAIKFILKSYIDFPKNIWNLFIHYSAFYWNKFIGRDEVIARQHVYRKVKLDL